MTPASPPCSSPCARDQGKEVGKLASVGSRGSRRQGHFPGGPVVKNLISNAGQLGSIPGQGAKIPHAAIQPRNHK